MSLSLPSETHPLVGSSALRPRFSEIRLTRIIFLSRNLYHNCQIMSSSRLAILKKTSRLIFLRIARFEPSRSPSDSFHGATMPHRLLGPTHAVIAFLTRASRIAHGLLASWKSWICKY